MVRLGWSGRPCCRLMSILDADAWNGTSLKRTPMDLPTFEANWELLKMTKTLVMAAVLLIPTAAMAQQKTFYDASGRVIGTATTSGNQTTFRDDRGRTTGRSATDSQGTTTLYDASGRVQGRTSKR